MISKRKKISRTLFSEVFSFGKNKNTEYFRVKIKKSDSPKFSIVVPKKVLKKAVDRNKFKRIFYNTIKDLDFETGINEYIFFTQKSAKGKTDDEIKKDIIAFLKDN